MLKVVGMLHSRVVAIHITQWFGIVDIVSLIWSAVCIRTSRMTSLPNVSMCRAISVAGGSLSGWLVFMTVNKLYVMSTRFGGGRVDEARRGPLSAIGQHAMPLCLSVDFYVSYEIFRLPHRVMLSQLWAILRASGRREIRTDASSWGRMSSK